MSADPWVALDRDVGVSVVFSVDADGRVVTPAPRVAASRERSATDRDDLGRAQRIAALITAHLGLSAVARPSGGNIEVDLSSDGWLGRCGAETGIIAGAAADVRRARPPLRSFGQSLTWDAVAQDVGLDALGLSADDVRSGTLPEWLHAVGDAGPGAPLTHMGKYEARVLGARLAGAHETPPPRDVPVPQVVFTDPQVAAVGSSEAQAREAGHDVVTVAVPFASAAGTALLRDDGVGSAKIVVDRATGCLLGATFVGHEAAELVHAATVAIVGQVPIGVLRHAVPSYPTSSELWLRLLEELPTNLR